MIPKVSGGTILCNCNCCAGVYFPVILKMILIGEGGRQDDEETGEGGEGVPHSTVLHQELRDGPPRVPRGMFPPRSCADG